MKTDFRNYAIKLPEPLSEETKAGILADYKGSRSVRETWHKFAHKRHTYSQVKEFLRQEGMLNKPGYYKRHDKPLEEDEERKPFTDKTLDFESEVRTALWK